MKKFVALLFALPLLIWGHEAIELQFQEGQQHVYEFSGYFPLPTSVAGNRAHRVKVNGKLEMVVDDVLQNGNALLTVTLLQFQADTGNDVCNQLTDTMLESMVVGGRSLWTVSPRGELLEFLSDSFFFYDSINQWIALGLFTPIVRGCLREEQYALKKTNGGKQFEIEFSGEQTDECGRLISLYMSRNDDDAEFSWFERVDFDQASGFAKELYHDIHFEKKKDRKFGKLDFTINVVKCN